MEFSPDGRYLATGRDDQTARLFEVTTGRELLLLPHRDKINAVTFSKDGELLVTASEDRTVRVFGVVNGNEVLHIALDAPPVALHFMDDMAHIVIARIHNWDVLDQKTTIFLNIYSLRLKDLVTDGCSRVTRNLTLNEWRQYVGKEIPYHRTCQNLPSPPIAREAN